MVFLTMGSDGQETAAMDFQTIRSFMSLFQTTLSLSWVPCWRKFLHFHMRLFTSSLQSYVMHPVFAILSLMSKKSVIILTMKIQSVWEKFPLETNIAIVVDSDLRHLIISRCHAFNLISIYPSVCLLLAKP